MQTLFLHRTEECGGGGARREATSDGGGARRLQPSFAVRASSHTHKLAQALRRSKSPPEVLRVPAHEIMRDADEAADGIVLTALALSRKLR